MEYSVNSYRKVAINKKFSSLKEVTEETTSYVSDPSKVIPEDFRRAALQVSKILDNTSEDIKEEIPRNMFVFLKASAIQDESFEIDLDKDIDEQYLTEKAEILIAIIYRSYLCPNKEALDKVLLRNEKKKKKFSIAEMEPEDVEDLKEDTNRLRKEYLNGLENFDSLDDYLDDEYEFNKFLEEREEDYTDDLSFKEKVNLKKLDRKTRKRVNKEEEMFEDRLESIDFDKEKKTRKEKSLVHKLVQKMKSKKNNDRDEE